MAKRRARKRARTSRRKTYRKKSTAKAAARKRGGSVYKVVGGWRISTRRRKRR